MKKLLLLLAVTLLFACSKEDPANFTIKVTKATSTYTVIVTGATAPVKFFVYSKSGSQVFESTNDALTFNWDGKTANGNTLADGVYSILVKDNEGKMKDGVIYLVSEEGSTN